MPTSSSARCGEGTRNHLGQVTMLQEGSSVGLSYLSELPNTLHLVGFFFFL